MQRQRGTGPSVFKSVERTQTYCQKEERFTVQNKITDASPHRRTAPKNKAIHSTQILICHEEQSAVQNKITDASPQQKTAPNRKTIHSTQILICHEEQSAVQNKKSAGAIETASRFGEYRKNLMNQSGKTHPKSKTLIRHKPLYPIEKYLEYKTRIRTEPNNEPIAASHLNTMRYIQITKQGLIKNALIVLTRTHPV